MPSVEQHREELDYLIRYARMSAVYFTLVWDAAEALVDERSSNSEVKECTLKLIGDLLDEGVKVGDMSVREGESVVPWNLSRGQVLERIAKEMDEHSDPLDYIPICWFSANQ